MRLSLGSNDVLLPDDPTIKEFVSTTSTSASDTFTFSPHQSRKWEVNLIRYRKWNTYFLDPQNPKIAYTISDVGEYKVQQRDIRSSRPVTLRRDIFVYHIEVEVCAPFPCKCITDIIIIKFYCITASQCYLELFIWSSERIIYSRVPCTCHRC